MEKKSNIKVAYQNELNLVPLKNFNAKQMDLFFALCGRMKNKGLDDVVFSFEELKELSDYKITALDPFVNDLEQLYKKMLNLTYRTETASKISYFVLFNGFEIDKDEQCVTVNVNPKLEHVINGISTEFNKFELLAFTKIQSKYSKTLFRLLMQFQSTGFYVVKIEDFRELLDVPKSYRMSDIDKQVLNLSIKELSEYFNDLKVKKIKARKGNKIDRLEFTFSGLKTDLPKVPLHDWTK